MDMINTYVKCSTPSATDLTRAIAQCVDEGAKSVLILASESEQWKPEDVDAILQGLNLPVIGGVFPRLILNEKTIRKGTLVVGLKASFELLVIEDISRSEEGIDQQLADCRKSFQNARTLLTFVDGLAKNIEYFVGSLYGLVGRACGTIGGGCGYLDFVQKPVLFTNQGLLEDAVAVAAFGVEHFPGVRHGWEVLAGPYLVTGAEANVVNTLNYRSAFHLYREEVEKHSEKRFSEHDFFSIAKTYPLGVQGPDRELVVRDPLRVEGDTLVCVGEVPQNATVYLLTGEIDRLIESAADAANFALTQFQRSAKSDNTQCTAFVFDCISRCLYMGAEYKRELSAISDELSKLESVAIGALTLGEISTSRNGAINLLNKSTVIAVF